MIHMIFLAKHTSRRYKASMEGMHIIRWLRKIACSNHLSIFTDRNLLNQLSWSLTQMQLLSTFYLSQEFLFSDHLLDFPIADMIGKILRLIPYKGFKLQLA